MKNNAFSLLEIIIAMLILSVTTAGAYSLFVTNHKMLINARHRLQAVEQASTVMEKLMMYVSEDPNYPTNAGTDNGHALDGDGVNGEIHQQPLTLIGLGNPVIDAGIEGTWSYHVLEDVSNTDCEKVTVTVQWNEL